MRAAVADVRPHTDQRGASLIRARTLQRCIKRRHIVAIVNLFDLPAIGGKASHHIFTERQRGRSRQ